MFGRSTIAAGFRKREKLPSIMSLTKGMVDKLDEFIRVDTQGRIGQWWEELGEEEKKKVKRERSV